MANALRKEPVSPTRVKTFKLGPSGWASEFSKERLGVVRRKAPVEEETARRKMQREKSTVCVLGTQ